jgi:hypothetical protein
VAPLPATCDSFVVVAGPRVGPAHVYAAERTRNQPASAKHASLYPRPL